VQVALRLICSNISNISVVSVRVEDLCFRVPFVGASEEICGWEALQTCYDHTNLKVV
jgi:hypothetical protein